MLALGPDNNLSPAEMEAERDRNISWRDGDTSDDGINLDASHSSRTPHDHPHLEEEGHHHPTLAHGKKKKKQHFTDQFFILPIDRNWFHLSSQIL